MSRYVVDASVALKWYLPEAHADCAARLRRDDAEFEAPDLLHAEVASALWKRVRRGELTAAEAGKLCEAAARLPITTYPARLLAGAALQIALATGLTVHDSLYIATALLTEGTLVTADRSLFDTARRQSVLRDKMLWIEDVPA